MKTEFKTCIISFVALDQYGEPTYFDASIIAIDLTITDPHTIAVNGIEMNFDKSVTVTGYETVPLPSKSPMGKMVTAQKATGGVYGAGRVVGYAPMPQLLIERNDGSTFWWNEHLCEYTTQQS
jgi:hypothetical protein